MDDQEFDEDILMKVYWEAIYYRDMLDYCRQILNTKKLPSCDLPEKPKFATTDLLRKIRKKPLHERIENLQIFLTSRIQRSQEDVQITDEMSLEDQILAWYSKGQKMTNLLTYDRLGKALIMLKQKSREEGDLTPYIETLRKIRFNENYANKIIQVHGVLCRAPNLKYCCVSIFDFLRNLKLIRDHVISRYRDFWCNEW